MRSSIQPGNWPPGLLNEFVTDWNFNVPESHAVRSLNLFSNLQRESGVHVG